MVLFAVVFTVLFVAVAVVVVDVPGCSRNILGVFCVVLFGWFLVSSLCSRAIASCYLAPTHALSTIMKRPL